MPSSAIKNSRDGHGVLLNRNGEFIGLYQHAPLPRAAPTGVSRRYSGLVRHPVQNTIPGPETPSLSDQERAARLRRLMERVFSPDGLDRDTLEHIEQLTGEDS